MPIFTVRNTREPRTGSKVDPDPARCFEKNWSPNRPSGIFLYTVELKACSKIALFELNICPNVPFFLFYFFKIFFFLQGEYDFCNSSTLDRFSAQPFSHFGPFFPFSTCAQTPIFIGFSAKHNIFVAHPQRSRNTICEHNCAT